MNENLHYPNEPFYCLECDIELQDKSKPVCSDECADRFTKQCEYEYKSQDKEEGV